MRLIRCFLLLLIVAVSQNMLAQVNCYEKTRQKGIDLYNKGDFQAAAKNFEAAKFCGDLPDDNDLDSWLDKCVVTVKLSSKRLEFAAASNEQQSVEVNTKAKTFKVSGAPSWCTVTQQGKMLSVNCADNEIVSPREAKITITAAGKMAVLEVYQASADLEVGFEPETVEFSSQSETVKVLVTTNVKDWTVESMPSWVAVERKEDTLSITCDKNTSSDFLNSAVVILASEQQFSLKISQLPGDTVLVANEKDIVFQNSASAERVHVKCNMAQWQVSTEDDWLKVSRKNDSIVVSANENQSLFSRHGTVKLSCGTRHNEVAVHQRPRVSKFVMPESELKSIKADKEFVTVNSYPSELVVYIDDSLVKTTPFTYPVDYEHHSMLVGFERREFLFNEKQQDIAFEPGLRFATLTFTAPKNIGLQTGFISANQFGAYSHFQASRPLVKDFACDTLKADGYHFMVGPVYSPIQYAAVYAGLGVGVHEGPSANGKPNIGFDFEAGAMGMYKNVMVSMGFRNTRWGPNDKRTSFVFGLGGYLKRYYDEKLGYCSSDSRRWWSVNYMSRPAANGHGLMFGDLGHEKVRTYLKAMYVQPTDTVKKVDASFGVLITPVNGIIDFCLGVGGGVNIQGQSSLYPTMELETGFIMNLWRFPLTVMLHESDIINDERHMYVDFGIGFHIGEFKRSSYK